MAGIVGRLVDTLRPLFRPTGTREDGTGNTMHFWHDCGLPVAVCLVTYSSVNAVANLFTLPHALLVNMVAGSAVTLFFVFRACRAGTLTAKDLGLGSMGWTPLRRLFALPVIILFAYGGFAGVKGATAQPDFGDFCFWFFSLLPASVAELLVFTGIAFCLPEQWLKRQGWHPAVAMAVAAAFSAVMFGLFHFTHEPQWGPYVFTLMPQMWLTLLYFKLTRNFHLTLMLHNAGAAVGFTELQYRTAVPGKYVDPKTYQTPLELAMTIVAFVVPYLILHVLEWRLRQRDEQHEIPGLAGLET